MWIQSFGLLDSSDLILIFHVVSESKGLKWAPLSCRGCCKTWSIWIPLFCSCTTSIGEQLVCNSSSHNVQWRDVNNSWTRTCCWSVSSHTLRALSPDGKPSPNARVQIPTMRGKSNPSLDSGTNWGQQLFLGLILVDVSSVQEVCSIGPERR